MYTDKEELKEHINGRLILPKPEHISDGIRNDKEFLLELIEINPYTFHFTSQELKDDDEFMIKCISINPFAFCGILNDKPYDKSLEVAFFAISKNNFFYSLCSQRIKRKIRDCGILNNLNIEQSANYLYNKLKADKEKKMLKEVLQLKKLKSKIKARRL